MISVCLDWQSGHGNGSLIWQNTEHKIEEQDGTGMQICHVEYLLGKVARGSRDAGPPRRTQVIDFRDCVEERC